jgi:uncharacterized membrane protein YkvA (DUF1232 family)
VTTAVDSFPRDRFLALLRRLPAYGRLGWRLARDPHLSRARRGAVAGAVAYLLSPIDLVPGIIPLAGQLDDAAVALLGLRIALGGLPAAEREAHLAASGLVAADLDEDLRTVRAGAAWMLRQGGRIGLRTSRAMVGFAARGLRSALRRATGA